MSENEKIEPQAAGEIPQAELAEGELESVSGGTGAILLIAGPLIDIPVIIEGTS